MKRLIVVLLLMASPAMALTEDTFPIIYQDKSVEFTQKPAIRTIAVTIGILGSQWELTLPEGATVNEAVEAISTVKHGLVCCDSRDIQCINGLCGDPYKGKYWLVRVNGNSQNYSSHSHLSSGDVVELLYVESGDHQELSKWLLSSSKGR